MTDRRLLVLWSGNVWSQLPATDHHLARAFAATHDVLWMDPPRSPLKGKARLVPRLGEVEPGLWVLEPPSMVGHTRPGLRQLTEASQRALHAWACRRLGRQPWASMVCSPRTELPRRGSSSGVTMLHVTDDWVAGAAMMGLDVEWIRTVLQRNVRAAEVVSAVSVDLARLLDELEPRRPVAVVPNGATVPAELPVVPPQERRDEAVLIGQLNERLDFELLQAVVDAGVPLRIIGPRTEREPRVKAALDRLLGSSGVTWMGPVQHTEVPGLLARARVGLTPYLVNDFNRSSFPLKTLEYMALGLPVVSTRLDSLDWLGTDLIDVADTPAQYAAAVRARVTEPPDAQADEARRAFAQQHSWPARVAELVRLADAVEVSR